MTFRTVRTRLVLAATSAAVIVAGVVGCSSTGHPDSGAGPTGRSSTPRSAGAPTVAGVPASIPATCSASSPDVTARLQGWIASVPDGSTIELPARACYRVEGTLLLKDRNNLRFEGHGATLRSFTDGTSYVHNLQTRHHVFLYGGSNLVFNDLNIVGDAPAHHYAAAYAGQSGFWVWGTQGLSITNSRVQDVRGDFVTLGPDTYRSWKWTSNVAITGDTFINAGRQGISLTGAQNVTISDNNISNTADSEIDIESDSRTGRPVDGVPTYGGAANVKIDSNQFGYSGTVFFANYGYCSQTSNISLTNNTLRDAPLVVWSKGCPNVHRTGWTITNNTSDRPFASPRAAIEFTYVDDATISGNTINFFPPQKVTAVRVWGCTQVTIAHNDFVGAATVLQSDRHWSGAPSTAVTSTDNVLQH